MEIQSRTCRETYDCLISQYRESERDRLAAVSRNGYFIATLNETYEERDAIAAERDKLRADRDLALSQVAELERQLKSVRLDRLPNGRFLPANYQRKQT